MSGPNTLPPVIGPENAQRIGVGAILGKGYVNQIAWSADLALVAISSTTGIWLYKSNALDELGQLLQGYQGDEMANLVFSPIGNLLASSDDTTIVLWDTRTASAKAVLRLLSGGYGLAFSPDGAVLAVANQHTISLWDVSSGTQRLAWQDNAGGDIYANNLAFSPDGRLLASGHSDNSIRLWDAQTGAPQGELIAPASSKSAFNLPYRPYAQTGITALAFSPEGNALASGGADNYVRIWDVPRRMQRASRADEVSGVASVAFSLDGNAVAYLGDTAWLWQFNSGKPAAFLDKSIRWRSLLFKPHNTVLALGVKDSVWRLWGLPPDPHKPLLSGFEYGIDYSVDDRYGDFIS